MVKGEDIGEKGKIDNGRYMVDYIAYEPILVTKENINETIIKDGFYTVEQIYANIDPNLWP